MEADTWPKLTNQNTMTWTQWLAQEQAVMNAEPTRLWGESCIFYLGPLAKKIYVVAREKAHLFHWELWLWE